MMTRNDREQCEAQIREALATGEPARLQAVVTTHHPADIADVRGRLDAAGRLGGDVTLRALVPAPPSAASARS
jgi:hypothetical protein